MSLALFVCVWGLLKYPLRSLHLPTSNSLQECSLTSGHPKCHGFLYTPFQTSKTQLSLIWVILSLSSIHLDITSSRKPPASGSDKVMPSVNSQSSFYFQVTALLSLWQGSILVFCFLLVFLYFPFHSQLVPHTFQRLGHSQHSTASSFIFRA